jgi:choline kinase
MNFIILASGRGSRLNKLTKKKPKCLTVIKNKKTLLDYLALNFNKRDNIIISTGYKANLVEKHLANKNIRYVRNKNFLNTNMVESLMLCKKKLEQGDLLIVYGDIYFDKKIINKIKNIRGNIIAVNANWLQSWKKRYSTLNKIREDAEDLIISKGKIISIGDKIGKKLPKFQYMGILKIEKKTFNKLEKFYKKINNKKISLTHFINETIKSKITTYNYSVFKNYWYEIDNISDLKYLKRNI